MFIVYDLLSLMQSYLDTRSGFVRGRTIIRDFPRLIRTLYLIETLEQAYNNIRGLGDSQLFYRRIDQ